MNRKQARKTITMRMIPDASGKLREKPFYVGKLYALSGSPRLLRSTRLLAVVTFFSAAVLFWVILLINPAASSFFGFLIPFIVMLLPICYGCMGSVCWYLWLRLPEPEKTAGQTEILVGKLPEHRVFETVRRCKRCALFCLVCTICSFVGETVFLCIWATNIVWYADGITLFGLLLLMIEFFLVWWNLRRIGAKEVGKTDGVPL